jgi:hypothetical protein
LAPSDAPQIPAAGAISQDPAEMPDSIDYDATNRRLLVVRGYVEGVDVRVWNYEISGNHVLRQWFSYRKANRERPIIGDRRKPSKLGNVQPDHWPAECTTELINVLNVLGRLVDLEQAQADLLERICSSQMIAGDELHKAGVLTTDANSGGGVVVGAAVISVTDMTTSRIATHGAGEGPIFGRERGAALLVRG